MHSDDPSRCVHQRTVARSRRRGVNAVTLVADGAQHGLLERRRYELRAARAGRPAHQRRHQHRPARPDTCALHGEQSADRPRCCARDVNGCATRVRPMQTNVRGTASYTIPWVDVLASAMFTVRPGVTINANYQVALTELTSRRARSGIRPAAPGPLPTAGSCRRTWLSNDTFGEGIRLVDFSWRRTSASPASGSTSASTSTTCSTRTRRSATAARSPIRSRHRGMRHRAAGLSPWGTVNNITTPRYARFQLQFDF